jgi:hypothetical protein
MSSALYAIAVAAIVLVAAFFALPLLGPGNALADWASGILWTAPSFFARIWRAVAPGPRREKPVTFPPIVAWTKAEGQGVVDANAGQPAVHRNVIKRLEDYGVPTVPAAAERSGSSATPAEQPTESPYTPPPAGLSESCVPEPPTVPIAVTGALGEPGGWEDELVTLIERMKKRRLALSLLVLQLDSEGARPEASAIVDALPARIAAGYGRAEARVWLDEPDVLFLALPGVLPRRASALWENFPYPFADTSSDGRASIVGFGVAGFPRDARNAGQLVAAARRSLEDAAVPDLNLWRAWTEPAEREAAPATEVWTSRT